METAKTFVLGAGFSASEQFPLVRGLRDRVLHFLQAERHRAYRTFLEAGNGGHEKGQFFAGLELAESSGVLGFEELLIKLKADLKNPQPKDPRHITNNVLRIGCARLLWWFQLSIWRVQQEYANFTQKVAAIPGSAIVSFNWDLLAEKALTDANIQWNYNLEDSAKVPVLKPHGSINWSGHLREGLSAQYSGWTPIQTGSQISFDVLSPLENPNKQEINSELRHMIFPGDLDSSSDPDIKLVWNSVATAIARSSKVVFIGYSLPQYDGFARSFFVRHCQGKLVEVFDPSPESLKRFKNTFGEGVTTCELRFEHCDYAKP